MYRFLLRRFLPACCASIALIIIAGPIGFPHTQQAQAATDANRMRGASGLPLPRFVSLKPARVNLRIGPGREYAVSWLFLKSGLPVEIIQEYDNWRRIRDSDGTEGWVYQSLLSGKRTAITAPWEKTGKMLALYGNPNDNAAIVAQIEPGVIGAVRECNGDWCRIDVSGVRGWLKQGELWGAYPGEAFD